MQLMNIFKLCKWKPVPSDFAEGQLNMRKLFAECFVHVFLQVGGLHIFNDRCLKTSTHSKEILNNLNSFKCCTLIIVQKKSFWFHDFYKFFYYNDAFFSSIRSIIFIKADMKLSYNVKEQKCSRLTSFICVGWFCSHHIRWKDNHSFVFPTRPLRIIQKIWVIIINVSPFESCFIKI